MNKTNSLKLLLSIVLLSSMAISIYPSTNSWAYEPESKYGYAYEYAQEEKDNTYNKQSYPADNGYYNDENKYEKDFFIFPPSPKIAELGDRWWQWAFSLNNETGNPFEELGQEGCDIGLQEDINVLFLVGGSPDSLPHNCTIPSDVKVFFPIVNVACNTLEVNTPFFGANEEEQRECANNFVDNAFDLQLEIDGVPINNLEQYRFESPPGGFEFEAVPGNFFNTPPGEGEGVSDGYWILLKLAPGQHTVSFQGSLDASDVLPPPDNIFTFGSTYNLNVESTNEEYLPYANEEYLPYANEEYLPYANEEYLPYANEEYLPYANEEYLPYANEEYLPYANEEYLPYTNEEYSISYSSY